MVIRADSNQYLHFKLHYLSTNIDKVGPNEERKS